MEKLPIIRKKREAKKTTLLIKHLFKNPSIFDIKETCAIEVKQTRTLCLPANSVKPHQLAYLKRVKHHIYAYKIPDMGRQNPFDVIVMKEIPAYVVVCYGNGQNVMIDVDKFPPINEKLPYEKAIMIGTLL